MNLILKPCVFSFGLPIAFTPLKYVAIDLSFEKVMHSKFLFFFSNEYFELPERRKRVRGKLFVGPIYIRDKAIFHAMANEKSNMQQQKCLFFFLRINKISPKKANGFPAEKTKKKQQKM